MYGVAVDSYCEQNSHNKFFSIIVAVLFAIRKMEVF